MHDNHEPECSFCANFVLPFDKEGPLAEWGYCSDEVNGGTLLPDDLKQIEKQVKKGDYSFISKGELPLYQPLGEGCEKFKH